MIDKQAKMEKARDLFLNGCNCAQAVAAAFAPEMGMDEKAVLRMASGFGGGMGGMRYTCGAVSGMCLVYNCLRGYDDLEDQEIKKHLYADVHRMGERFMAEHDTLICRELLAKNDIEAKAEPSPRTPEYYRTRPCARYVESCAAILCDALNEGNE